tara:strand:+ start:542 stop:1636 length:1095 start_codon:yes stop_codon:yes gene_type:complete
MKILSIIKTSDLSHGGPPVVLNNQMNLINKRGKIITSLKLGSLSTIYLIKCFFLKPYRIKMYNLLKKFDIVHFHEIWSIKVILVVYFCNKLLIKFFFVGHGYLDAWSINQKLIKKKLFMRFFLQPAYDSAIASFFSTKDEYLEAKKNIKIHKPFIIPNGISLSQFKKRKLNLKKKKKILFFGRVHKKKGLDLLLRVIKNLPNNYFDEFSFDITGPGLNEDVDNLKKKITEFSLEKKVKYNPPIYGDKKIEYLNKHDVFILPSFEEGDSIALKEALGSYLPVIISKQCRLDIVEKFNAGLVIDTNEESLLQGLLKLRSLDLIKMGYQARKLVEENYDNIVCCERLKLIYNDIFNETHKSRDWVSD